MTFRKKNKLFEANCLSTKPCIVFQEWSSVYHVTLSHSNIRAMANKKRHEGEGGGENGFYNELEQQHLLSLDVTVEVGKERISSMEKEQKEREMGEQQLMG